MFFWKPSRESGHWLFNCTSLTHTQQPPAFPPSCEKVVPIPMTAMMCKNKCCKATYCPLTLSFAKTCHTFQGQSAGPVSHGQQPNAVDRVIVDPGDKGMEGKNPGLLYIWQCQEQPPLAMLATTAVSREGDGKTQQSTSLGTT